MAGNFSAKTLLAGGALAAALISGSANAALIASEDFEGGATGWSNNTTTVGNATFTEFLGRFGGSGGAQAVSKTFALSGTQTQVDISFDFYEIDSWDGESFFVFIDDVATIVDAFQHGAFDNPPLATPVAGNGGTNLGFGGFSDQTYTYNFSVNTSASSIKLGFGSTLNQSIPDESYGIDNLLITDNSQVGQVPEPLSLSLIGAGLVGVVAARRRKAS